MVAGALAFATSLLAPAAARAEREGLMLGGSFGLGVTRTNSVGVDVDVSLRAGWLVTPDVALFLGFSTLWSDNISEADSDPERSSIYSLGARHWYCESEWVEGYLGVARVEDPRPGSLTSWDPGFDVLYRGAGAGVSIGRDWRIRGRYWVTADAHLNYAYYPNAADAAIVAIAAGLTWL